MPVDARGRIALRIEPGETEFESHVGSQGREHRVGIRRIGIASPEIRVEYFHLTVHLRVGNILQPALVDDVEDGGDGLNTGACSMQA